MTYAELAETLPEQDREHVRELAENVMFMRRKLEESRRGMDKQQVVVPYDNGGGQEGIRENPAFTGYHKLLKSYISALEELRSIVAAEPAQAKPASTLAAQREKARYGRLRAV